MSDGDSILTSQSRFDYAVNIVLNNEGGYSNDPDDPGGATNFGITKSDLNEHGKSLNLPTSVQELTIDDAKTFYKTIYWDRYHYEAINSLTIATKVFDLAVNMGPQEAHKLIQRALKWSGYGVEEDGVLGPKTLAAINQMCLYNREQDLDDEIKAEASHYYEHITEENPKLYKFLKGWLKRAEE